MITVKGKTFSIEEFKNICKDSESYREVAIKLGYSPSCGSSVTNRIKNFIQEYQIDITHFLGQGHKKNLGKKRTPLEKYLNNEVKITSHKLRIRLLEEGLLERKCSCCGLTSWLNHPIPLELHHKDGNTNNNNLSNLELRCPNCHYFTDNYKSKNRST